MGTKRWTAKLFDASPEDPYYSMTLFVAKKDALE